MLYIIIIYHFLSLHNIYYFVSSLPSRETNRRLRWLGKDIEPPQLSPAALSFPARQN